MKYDNCNYCKTNRTCRYSLQQKLRQKVSWWGEQVQQVHKRCSSLVLDWHQASVLYLWWPYVYPWNWPCKWNWNDCMCDICISYESLYIQMAWCRTAVSPVWWRWRGCCLAQIRPFCVWAGAWCLTGNRPPSIFMMTLCLPTKLAMCLALKWVCVWHERHMGAHISRWLDGDCSVSSAFTLEMLQSCTKASI